MVPSSGHRHLEVREDFEQERLELRLRLVDLVDEQDDGIGGLDGLQQRPRREEAMREEGVVLARDPGDRIRQRRRVGDQLADALAQQLGVEELLGVLPLVQRLALVEPFVALQANQPPVGDLGQRLGQLGLADARRAFDEHRPSHALRQEHHGADAAVGDVAGVLEVLLDVLRRLEHLGSCLSELARSVAHLRAAGTPGPSTWRFASRRAILEGMSEPKPDGSEARSYHRWQFRLGVARHSPHRGLSRRAPRDGRLPRISAICSPHGHRTGGSRVPSALLILGVGHQLLTLPLSWLGGFWLPRRYGLHHQTLRPWLRGPGQGRPHRAGLADGGRPSSCTGCCARRRGGGCGRRPPSSSGRRCWPS